MTVKICPDTMTVPVLAPPELAAVLGDEFHGLGGIERVGVVLSGGNVNLDRLPWLGPS